MILEFTTIARTTQEVITDTIHVDELSMPGERSTATITLSLTKISDSKLGRLLALRVLENSPTDVGKHELFLISKGDFIPTLKLR